MNVNDMPAEIYSWNRAFVASATAIVGGLYGAITELPLVSILSMIAAIVPPVVKIIHEMIKDHRGDHSEIIESKDKEIASRDRTIESKDREIETLKGEMLTTTKALEAKIDAAVKKSKDVEFELEVFRRSMSMQEE